jgi:pilus assembly protein Flp/PilA
VSYGLLFQHSQRRTTVRKFGQFVVAFLKAEDGPTAVEYAVMLALIIVVCIGSIAILGSNANKTFTTVGSVISTAGS